MLKRILTSLLIATFTVSGLSLPPMAHAQPLLGLPEPGKMVSLSPAYAPAMIKGVTVNKDNPFQFDFIVDVGQDKLEGEALKAEGDRLIKYFLASLAIPQQDLWVNLSPYEKDKTVPEALGQTDMGRDLLAQDYILKQVTASLIYPEKSLGKTFWDRVYAKSQELYGNTQIPVNTFNKVWITADQAEVFEHGQTAFVTKSHLKVMLEEDYLATQTNTNVETRFIASHTTNRTTQNIIRDIILPELEREVNEGKNFAKLRQISNSLILASWYKKNLKESLLNQVYANQSTVKGIDIDDKTIKEQIYSRYLQAYKKGVFNIIKEDNVNNQITPRKYFSGGWDPGMLARPQMTTDRAVLLRELKDEKRFVNFGVQTTPLNETPKIDFAQSSKPIKIVDDLIEYFQKISLQEDVTEDKKDALNRGLAQLKNIFLAKDVREESIVQAINDLSVILHDFILTPGQLKVFSELEMFLPKLASAQKQINDVAAQYDDWNLETYNLISQHVIKTVSNQGLVMYKLSRLDTINQTDRPVLSFFQYNEGSPVERGLIDDLRANVALVEEVMPEFISVYAIDNDFRSFLLYMAVKFNWISLPDPRDENFLQMKKQLLALSDQYGVGSTYGVVWSKPTTVVTSMVEAREKSKDYIGLEYQGRGVVSLVIGILNKVVRELIVDNQTINQIQRFITDFEQVLKGADEDKIKAVFSDLKTRMTSNLNRNKNVDLILAEIEKMLPNLAVVEKYFDKKFVEKNFSDWDHGKYEEFDQDTFKFTVTSHFKQGASHVIGYGYKQHVSDEIDASALNEDLLTFVYETTLRDAELEVQLKEKIVAMRRFAELVNERESIFNKEISGVDTLRERDYFLFLAVQLGLMNAPDPAKLMRQDEWEAEYNSKIRELVMLLREHRKTKDSELFSGVSEQIGPTKLELAEYLEMSEDNIEFQALFKRWSNDGVPDQELQEMNEANLKKHNYLQSYFANNFLLISRENKDLEHLLWLKNKYYESFLSRYQDVSIDSTAYYDPQEALKNFLEKNPEIVDRQKRQQQKDLENHAMASTSDLLDIADRISRINILIDEVILDGINSSEQRRLLELTQERAELIGALNKLKVNGNDNKRIAEVNTAVLKEGILAIINNWMAAGKRRFNLTKNYYTEKISQSNDDEVVLLYVGEKYNPAGILLGFLEDNHWVIEIVEVEKSETGGGSGDLLVRKFIEQYGQDLMIELDIDYIGNNTSGLHNWRQKLKNLGFYGTETQLYKQPTNPIESGVNNIRAYEYPIAMQSSKNHITVADILISQLRRGLVLRKEFKQRIHEDLDGIVLENNEDPKKMQEIVRQLIASEYESSKNDYERLKREYDSSLFINPSDITLDQLKKLKKYYLSLEQMLQSDKSLLDLFLKIEGKDNAQSAEYGGIDLQATADNIAVKKAAGSQGVQMEIDAALIERIKREGIESLRPVIFSITPVVDIWKMIGLTPPVAPLLQISP